MRPRLKVWIKGQDGRVMLSEWRVAKLQRLRGLGLPSHLFGDVSLKVVERFRQRAAVEAPSELRAHGLALRATLLAALCWLRGREVTDSLVDLLIQVIHKIGVRAEKRVDKELLNDLKRVTGKVGLLFHIAEASVEQPDGRVRDVVFPAAGGEQKLRDDLRGREPQVTKEFLHLVDRYVPGVEQDGRDRMPQQMRVDPLGDIRFSRTRATMVCTLRTE